MAQDRILKEIRLRTGSDDLIDYKRNLAPSAGGLILVAIATWHPIRVFLGNWAGWFPVGRKELLSFDANNHNILWSV